MIKAKYAISCLKQGFQRYIRHKKIDATIECSSNTVSFYVKDFDTSKKQYLARASDHHLKMQRIADKDEPWKGDNISIAFIAPKTLQDTRIRSRVTQNSLGTIQPFSVTTYQYNNKLLDENDLGNIFHSIESFLNGNGYTDPFKGTPKAAKVIPRNANIKPHKPPKTPTNISVDNNGNYNAATKQGHGADYTIENKQYKTENNMRNNKRTIRLTENRLRGMVQEVVKHVLRESSDSVNSQPFGRPEDDTYVPSEEEIKQGDKFFSEHCPWRQIPSCKTLEGLISWAYYNRDEFDNGNLRFSWLLYDLYNMS